MNRLPVPPIPDLARISGETRDEVVAWLREYYGAKKAFFNYLCATRIVKQSYRGLHNLPQLLAGCDREKSKQGKKSNREVVSFAAPLAFGRKLQVFDLRSRQFTFGRDRHAAYRIPFFYVENEKIVLYFLQPRKGFDLNADQLGMVATVHKRFLLDNEFYEQPSDVEYVDVSADIASGQRALRTFQLADLNLWSEERLQDRLTLISEALDMIECEGIDVYRRKQAPKPTNDLPLF